MVIKDGAKMSKSFGNIVDPDEMVKKFGADTVRVFMLFASPVQRDLDWSDEGIEGAYRFLNRLWNLVQTTIPEIRKIRDGELNLDKLSSPARELRLKVHKTVKKVTEDLERFQYNTAIAAIMELLNAASRFNSKEKDDLPVLAESVEYLVRLLYPMAPHIAEELWEQMGYDGTLVENPWLQWNKQLVESASITIVIQVNGKL
jgi:leucyl-tRNA synthetase